ncbi:hypothetical protein FIL70_02230 [Sphingobium fuliginis ATCC 27551]|uniref:Uncharacterized protein n=2 Tax=Sphingomonadaceae TaxID=41297 RepID=A0A5B8C9X2_SPHSA|nr:hypothetical protein FIL70_02230 [Sphingobium fuliginis ATCC 27551]UXC91262.1 hypothetical protein EGM87_01900 [Sphingobium sp. RSMS]
MPPALEHFCKAWEAVIGRGMKVALMQWTAAGAKANRHSDDDEPKMVVFRDPERSLLKVGEHRKHGKASFAGRQG